MELSKVFCKLYMKGEIFATSIVHEEFVVSYVYL